jgi:sugar lactone lactonase YvrE
MDTEAPVSEAFPETGLYASPVTVKIVVSEVDAKVHYTIDGSAPGLSSPVYTEPLLIREDTVLKFFSVDPAGNREALREATYLFDDEPPATVVDPPGGNYVPPIHVTLQTEETARIHYSLDGSDPDLESPVYLSGFVFKKPELLKFFAVDRAGNREEIQIHEYGLVNGVWQKYARGVYLIPSVTDGKTFWMGSESGLAAYNVGSGNRTFIGEPEGLRGTVINDLMLDEEGVLWIATDRGLNRYREVNGFTHLSSEEGLPDGEVLGLGLDRDGSVWAGTKRGVSRVHSGVVQETLTVSDGLPDNTVMSIAVDRNGDKWFGTLEGLARLSGNEWRVFTRRNGLINNEVRTVAVDADGHVWAGTPRGISVFDGESWRNYTGKDGLPGSAVVLIAPDPDGQVWVATRTGVARFSNGEWIKENPP